MKPKTNFSARIRHLLLLVFILIVSQICCSSLQIDLLPFQKLAHHAKCAELRNRLFLIDNELVFWERDGNCPDNSFSQILFGKTPQEILCMYRDSVGGPKKTINNEAYQEMFQTILSHIYSENLGLDSKHKVKEIPF